MTHDNSINNPHDRFVRRFLGDIDQARDLVAWHLPPDVLAELNLDSMRPAKESFIDKTLREGLSDLVFDVRLASGGDAYVVLLFEHKSIAEERTVFQVLRYIVGINEQRERRNQPLCCVIPLVLYHGRGRWNVAQRLPELIESPVSLRCYIPDFTMPLLDLSQCADEELRGESVLLAYMSLLKYIKRDELPERLPEILGLFRKLLPPATALESFESILRYLATGTDRVSRDELRTVITKVIQTEGASIMPTIAEEWKQEGRQEGRQEGIEKGKLIGRIRTVEEVLGQEVSSEESLKGLDMNELQGLVDKLNAVLHSQR